MTTTENNKLLADFLGAKQYHKEDDFIYFDETNNMFSNDTISIKNLKFHSDWNWLMSVVEKIESIEDKQGCTFFVEISKERVHIKYYYKGEEFSNIFAYNYNGKSKIEIVYKACVEFVKWYNQQN